MLNLRSDIRCALLFQKESFTFTVDIKMGPTKLYGSSTRSKMSVRGLFLRAILHERKTEPDQGPLVVDKTRKFAREFHNSCQLDVSVRSLTKAGCTLAVVLLEQRTDHLHYELSFLFPPKSPLTPSTNLPIASESLST